jgi:hypothetical protein
VIIVSRGCFDKNSRPIFHNFLWGKPVIEEEIKLAKRQGRRFKKLFAELAAHSADWGDLDNYFLGEISNIAAELSRLASEMDEYIVDRKSEIR